MKKTILIVIASVCLGLLLFADKLYQAGLDLYAIAIAINTLD